MKTLVIKKVKTSRCASLLQINCTCNSSNQKKEFISLFSLFYLQTQTLRLFTSSGYFKHLRSANINIMKHFSPFRSLSILFLTAFFVLFSHIFWTFGESGPQSRIPNISHFYMKVLKFCQA